MYLCYVDESGDPGKNGSKHLILGAAAVFEGQWSYLRDDIEGLLSKYFPAPLRRPAELHMADLRKGHEEFRQLHLPQRAALIKEFCSVVSHRYDPELALFTVIVDKKYWFDKNPGKTGDDLYELLFEELTSRFDLFMRRRYAIANAPTKGIFVVDPHKPSLSQSLKRNHARFLTSGTRWARLYNVIETVMFLDSQDSPGLQVADLTSFATWRAVECADPSIAKQIASKFDREPMSSPVNAGKWHGVKYIGENINIIQMLHSIWA